MNQMAATQIWLNATTFNPTAAEELYKNEQGMRTLLHCAILASEAKYEGDSDQSTKHPNNARIIGDASETALLRLV